MILPQNSVSVPGVVLFALLKNAWLQMLHSVSHDYQILIHNNERHREERESILRPFLAV
ncbi:hypothetical protein BAT_0067 [Bacillus pumilus ATCC 7061]|nr:hypothetical protein BAT_0067 [Bacillus pumilus ATCC 7061]